MGKNKLNKVYRLTVTEDSTHREVRSLRFTRLGMVLTGITAFVVVLGSLYALIALTPLRTTRWKLYSENLSRVLSGDTTINIDSLLVSENE